MSSCLKSCGDCGSAYHAPGCRRAGTRKSRAPSGVERVRIGVSISRKSRSLRTVRIAAMTSWRSTIASCMRARRRSTMRWRRRMFSSTAVSSSTANGGGCDGDRRRLGRRQALQRADVDLDLACRQVRVDFLLGALDDLALGGDDVLGAQVLGEAERVAGGLRVDDELHDAGAVAQVDEDQAAVVAAAVHPSGQAHLGAAAVGAQLPAPRVAVDVRLRRLPHAGCRPFSARATAADADSTVCWSPDSMSLSDIPSSPRMATYRAPRRSACLSWPFIERPANSCCTARPARRASVASANAAARPLSFAVAT